MSTNAILKRVGATAITGSYHTTVRQRQRRNNWFRIISLLISVWATGCTTGPESPRGFSLPKGSAEAGKQAFVELECTACHTVAKLELAPPDEIFEVSVVLGGQRESIITYAELVTSIINPSHKFVRGYSKEQIQSNGESKMPIYNDIMTVAQLIDLVTFLEQHYEITPYRPTTYPYM